MAAVILPQRKAVAMVVPELQPGGREVSLVLTAEALREYHGWQTTFLVTESRGHWFEYLSSRSFPCRDLSQHFWESRRMHSRRIAHVLSTFDVGLLNHSIAAQAAAGCVDAGVALVSIIRMMDQGSVDLAISSYGDIDGIIAISPRLYLSCYSHQRSNVRMIPPPILGVAGDPPRRQGDRLRLIYVGRMEASKGIYQLPSILSHLQRHASRIELLLVGDGPDLVPAIRQCQDARPEVIVSKTGWVPHRKAVELLASSDVLLFPSESEGFGRVLQEAMAAGTVPVACLIPGVTDYIVEHGVTGFLTPAGRPYAMAAAVERLLMNADLRFAMAKRAKESTLSRFSPRAVANEYVQFFDEILGRRTTSQHPRTGQLNGCLLGGCGQFLPQSVLSLCVRGIRSLGM